MILHIHSKASFLSDPGEKSRARGYHYISMASVVPDKANINQLTLNGPIHAEYTTIRNVLVSTIESELGALFVNCQRCAAMRMALIKMVHAQPPTPAVTGSATGDEFVNEMICQ